MPQDAVIGTFQASAAATTIPLTGAAAVAAGARAFVAVQGQSVATITLADNSGNGYTWTEILTFTKGGDHRVSIFTTLATAGLASGTVYTATFSASTGGRMIGGISFTGTDTSAGSGSVDVTSTKTEDTSVAAWVANNLVTTVATDLIIGLAAIYASGSPTQVPSGSYVEGFDFTLSGGQESFTLVYQEVAATGTYAPGGTWTPTPTGAEAIILGVAIKRVAGGLTYHGKV